MANSPSTLSSKNKKKIPDNIGVGKRVLKAYAPIISLLSKSQTEPLAKCILSILPEEGVDAVCECLHNALHSKLVGERGLKQLTTVSDRRAIRFLASGKGSVKKRRSEIIKNSEDIAKTLSAIFPILKRVLVRKK